MADVIVTNSSLQDVLTDRKVKVSVAVPLAAFSEGWEKLSAAFDQSPSHQNMHEEGVISEDVLPILCGLFHHIASLLPMETLEFHKWAASNDIDDHTWWFIAGEIGKVENRWHLIDNLTESALDDLTDFLIGFRNGKQKAA